MNPSRIKTVSGPGGGAQYLLANFLTANCKAGRNSRVPSMNQKELHSIPLNYSFSITEGSNDQSDSLVRRRSQVRSLGHSLFERKKGRGLQLIANPIVYQAALISCDLASAELKLEKLGNLECALLHYIVENQKITISGTLFAIKNVC